MAKLLAKAQEHPWTSEWLFGDSYRYYLGLLAAEERRGAPFDVIEFPDFGGWAVATVEAKRAGLAFPNTRIAVRIHSTQGMLYGVERFAYDPGHWAGIMFDAERHLYAHADLVVGHDPAITAHTARFYALEDRWTGRTRLEFPPVYVATKAGSYSRADKAEVSTDQAPCEDFLFGSRLQPVKRPDLFIRAAILFLERHPDHRGRFRLVCNGWDRTFIEGIKSLVPAELRERIVFIEKASQEDRLHFIDHSIVVVPSDYESLCLFAFEAAIAGRTVILNGSCPAFGNGFRWRDGENCLLFDGSVESLTDVMERALSWRASAVVEVEPSQPYWLDPAFVAPPAKPLPPGKRGKIAVVCYGAQSPVEFHRHFDLARSLEQELVTAGIAHEFVFQFPRGSMAADGPECDLVRDRGWTVAFSSGIRECPQMFGKRLQSLGKETVLLFPFGYQPAPGFAARAIAVLRSNPALSIVAGHIELADPHSGRSDCIRTYSGEAPSTALLASRIAPSLCALNTAVLSRIPFDPWAGEFWFEVFARTCSLRNEPIVIMPIIVGTLDPLMQHRPETSKRIAAGLLDQLGVASGWQARLLSVDPAQVPGAAEVRPLIYQANQMRQIFRINPVGPVRSWEPVGWQEDANGVLIHPLDGEVTIGELSGPMRRVSMILARVQNVRHDNAGAEAAIALARSDVTVSQILALVASGEPSDQIALSAWTRIEPNSVKQIALPCYGVSKGQDKLLLLTRPSPGATADNAVIVFTGLEIHFNNLSIG
ncbi:hypothetical protein [Novosphingobium sp.]|uniref:glycosyltransferase n=1 Tax=Novosphingobium sp. TaxID=1874826 RepID=UPI002607CDBA|nr:hypothetical protein [Novosphingobium sp.]